MRLLIGLAFWGLSLVGVPLQAQLLYPIPLRNENGDWLWSKQHEPADKISVWISPNFEKYKTTDGKPHTHSIVNALAYVGRITNLGFIKTEDFDNAWFRIHQADVCYYSRSWNAKEWFGSQAYCSDYLAVHPNKRDIVIGTRTKAAYGGGPLSPRNVIHFVQNALGQCLHGLPYHDPYSPMHAARNANFSGAIHFPFEMSDIRAIGLAGFDTYEIGVWQAFTRRRVGNHDPWIIPFIRLAPLRTKDNNEPSIIEHPLVLRSFDCVPSIQYYVCP